MAWVWKLWKGEGDPSQKEDSHRNIEPTPPTRFDTHPPIVQYVDSNRKRADEKKSKRRYARSTPEAEGETHQKTKPTNAKKRPANEDNGAGRVAKKAKADQEIENTSYQVHVSENEAGVFDIDEMTTPRDPSTERAEEQTALVLRKIPETEARSRKQAKIDLGNNTTWPSCDVLDDTNSKDQDETRLVASVSEDPRSRDLGVAGDVEAPYRTDTDGIIEDTPVLVDPVRTTTEDPVDASDAGLGIPGDTASTKKLRWPYVPKTWPHEYVNTASTQLNGTASLCPSGRVVGIGMWPGSSHIPGQPKVHGNKSAVLALHATRIRILQENTAVPIPASTTQRRLSNGATIPLPPLCQQKKPQRRELCTARERSLKPKRRTTGPSQKALEGIWNQSVGNPMGPTEWTG